jgi:hypothetical protein
LGATPHDLRPLERPAARTTLPRVHLDREVRSRLIYPHASLARIFRADLDSRETLLWRKAMKQHLSIIAMAAALALLSTGPANAR